MTYPSSLTDTQWHLIETIFEEEMLLRKRAWPLRSILDAIFYVIIGGVQWRMIPSDLPCWQTAITITTNGAQMVAGRCFTTASASMAKKTFRVWAIIDSQSVKVVQQSEARGYDAAKRVKGRKRHLMTDNLGLLIVLYPPYELQV